MVGDRDRAQPARLGLGEQHLDRRGAVIRMVGVHVQVDVDQPAATRAARAAAGSPPDVAPARGQPVVHAPRAARRPASTRTARAARPARSQPARAAAARRSAARAGRERVARRRARTAARSRRPTAAPRRPAAARRRPRRPARERSHQRPGAGRSPSEASTSTSAFASASTSPTVARSRRTRPGRGAAQPSVAGSVSGPRDQTVACQSRSGGQAPQRPQERPQRRPLLVGDTRAARRGPDAGACGGVDVGPGQDHLVVARGSSAASGRGWPDSSRSARPGGRTAVAKRPRELRREQPLGRRVEAPDVQRARVAQRDARGARGERLVDVHEVERERPSSSSIVRATSTGSEAARRRVGANGSTSPTPSTTRPVGRTLEQRLGRRGSPAACPGPARADSDGATIRTRWPRAASSSEIRATYWLTSAGVSQANGVTCAIARPSGTASVYGGASPAGSGSPYALALAFAFGRLPAASVPCSRAYLAMNAWVWS